MLSQKWLRDKFAWIHFLEQTMYLEEQLAEEKRELRKRLREDDEESAKSRVVKSDIDGYVLLMELPEWIETYEEADEYFRENEYIRPYYTYYDCTGRPFTRWYKLFLRRGRWYAYHSVGFDV